MIFTSVSRQLNTLRPQGSAASYGPTLKHSQANEAVASVTMPSGAQPITVVQSALTRLAKAA